MQYPSDLRANVFAAGRCLYFQVTSAYVSEKLLSFLDCQLHLTDAFTLGVYVSPWYMDVLSWSLFEQNRLSLHLLAGIFGATANLATS